MAGMGGLDSSGNTVECQSSDELLRRKGRLTQQQGCLEMQGLVYVVSTGMAPRNQVDQKKTTALFRHGKQGGSSLSFRRAVIWQRSA